MPELGNMLFDQCDGGYEIPRGVGFEDELKRLFDAIDPDRDRSWRDYGPSFENRTFQIWPYSWCDCDCGYDQVEAEWSKENRHREECYQQKLHKSVKEWDAINDYEAVEKASYCDIQRQESGKFGTTYISERSPKAEEAHKKWCALYDQRNKFKESTCLQLCRDLGIAWNKGCGSAVHCTCDYKKRWAIFRESHNHDLRCQVARKSFLFKPGEFWIDWYKYPLRDAHSNKRMSVEEFAEIVDKCIASLENDSGGPVLTLASLTPAT